MSDEQVQLATHFQDEGSLLNSYFMPLTQIGNELCLLQ